MKNFFFSIFKDKYLLFWIVFGLGLVVFAVTIKLGGVILFPGLRFNLVADFAQRLSPLWVPLVLCVMFIQFWMRYANASFINEGGSVLLEIKIPKETNKSPLAMEIFFTSLYQRGAITYTEAFLNGKVRPWFSMEIASFEGQVKFFVWTIRKWKNLVETQLYAQYPGIEVFETEDYALSVNHNPEKLTMWGTYFKLTNKDVYPIKTYVDYGLDKLELKEEFKVDPITSILEYLGSMGEGEQAWIQIIIQAHREEGLRQGRIFPRESWEKDIGAEVKKIREEATPKVAGSTFRFPNPTPGQVEAIKALERSKDKFAFDTIVRGFYIAENKSFNPIGIAGLVGSFRQYSSNNLNGFKLGWYTDFADLTKDIFNLIFFPSKLAQSIRRSYERQMLKAYKLRSFFHLPFKNFHALPFILTTEELATVFHFPGGVAKTPTLDRIPSKKSEPPTNLPI